MALEPSRVWDSFLKSALVITFFWTVFPQGLLGCTHSLQSLYLFSFKTEQEPGVRDISGLMDGGAYPSEARSWIHTPPYAVDDG